MRVLRHSRVVIEPDRRTNPDANRAAGKHPNREQHMGDTNADGPKPTPPAKGGTKPAVDSTTRLPDDHPLVTAYARQKAENDDLKEKARRLDEIEDAAKTETEKAAERLANAQREVDQIPAKVAAGLRAHLIARHSISDDDAELFLTATDPDTLLKQVDRLVERVGGPQPGVVPSQGTADPGSAQVSSFELGRERGRARYQKQN